MREACRSAAGIAVLVLGLHRQGCKARRGRAHGEPRLYAKAPVFGRVGLDGLTKGYLALAAPGVFNRRWRQ